MGTRKIVVGALSAVLASGLAAASPPGMPAPSGPAPTVPLAVVPAGQRAGTYGEVARLQQQAAVVEEQVKLAKEQAELQKIQLGMQESSSISDGGPLLEPGASAQVVNVRGVRGGGMAATLLLPSGGLLDVTQGEHVDGVGRVVSIGLGGVRVAAHGHIHLLSFVRPQSAADEESSVGGPSGALSTPPLPGSAPIPVSPPAASAREPRFAPRNSDER
jgi:type IV pilus biogenesis protein PilP